MKIKSVINSLLSLALLCNFPLPVQAQRVAVKRPSKALVKAIRERIPSDHYSRTSYYLTEIDLNNDGAKDAIVYISGPLCGNRKCNVFVFQRKGSRYRLIFDGMATQPKVAVLKSKSRGWFDIATINYEFDRGVHWRVWKYDGTSYENSYQELRSTPSRIVLNPKPDSAIELTDQGGR